jgi:hypothetical protein
MDIYELFAFGIIGFLSGTITGLYLFYRLKKDRLLEDTALNIIESVASDEETQKFVYQIGGILGAGVKGGVGLDTPTKNRGGRFRWQDMALELATQFITKSIQNPSPSPAPSLIPQSQDILAKKISDKW